MRLLQTQYTRFQLITIKHYLFFIIIAIFTTNTYSTHYHPNLETSYKVGNIRQIGRASILLPLWQKENQLLYFNAIGMMDDKNNQEVNFGFGYRKILNNIILGGFGHYDKKSSPNNNLFHQGTLGLELFSEIFEARLNGYVSFSKRKVLGKNTGESSIRHNSANIFSGDRFRKRVEVPLHGLDVELGAKLGPLPASIYGGYYCFGRSGAKRISGPSGRLDIKLTNWLSLGGEAKYDEIRKFQYYVGVHLRFSNNRDQNSSPFSLYTKMTQMPVRDVDVLTSEEETDDSDSSALKSSNSKEKAAESSEDDGAKDDDEDSEDEDWEEDKDSPQTRRKPCTNLAEVREQLRVLDTKVTEYVERCDARTHVIQEKLREDLDLIESKKEARKKQFLGNLEVTKRKKMGELKEDLDRLARIRAKHEEIYSGQVAASKKAASKTVLQGCEEKKRAKGEEGRTMLARLKEVQEENITEIIADFDAQKEVKLKEAQERCERLGRAKIKRKETAIKVGEAIQEDKKRIDAARQGKK